VLPPTLATDAGVVWLLDRAGPSLRRFDPIARRFVVLPGWGEGAGGAREFGHRAAVAATCGQLAVVDPDRGTVVLVQAATLTVRAVLRTSVPPVAVAAHAGRFSVLDEGGGVWWTTPRADALAAAPEPARPPVGTWDRIAVDEDGRAVRVDTAGRRLAVVTPGGAWDVDTDPEAVRERFDPPPVVVDRWGRFRVPACFRLVDDADEPWYDAQGDPCRVRVEEYAGRPPYLREGTWTSRAFDSGELGCRWYRLTVDVDCPPGCAVTIATYTSDDPVPPEGVDPAAWSAVHRVVHPTDDDRRPESDFAVLSPRGRFLVLRVGCTGDGWSTPTVRGLVLEPETPGLERFLPAIYRGGDADFLRRFLAIFGAEIDTVEQELQSLPARFSPRAVPARLLDSLAGELGVALERGWTVAQRRAMLVAAPPWHRKRGTPAAMRALVRAHLEARTGAGLDSSVPVLVEGFRERPSALVGRVRLPMTSGERTWSDDEVDRPFLGRPGAEEIELVSVGDPSTDRFRVYANRFRLVVPRPLVRGQADRDSLERLIAVEKPAHVTHELQLVEPRAIVGEQGSLGVDTFVGDFPPARLVGYGCCDGNVLGLGLRLAGGPGAAAPASVGRGERVGAGTVLV
jgi:phage tail-like protein